MSINIALFGPGNVGSGVLEILENKKQFIKKQFNIELNIKYIYVRNLSKYKHLNLDILETDFNKILNDDSIDVIIETMGGLEFADEIISKSLKLSKIVITANKDILSYNLKKYIQLCDLYDTSIGIEASVCGGMPIINTLFGSLYLDNINSFYGIVNGTTNYILSNMEDNNISFDEVLQKAITHGYAEADPTSDIDGHDISYKICILTKLIHGANINPDNIWSQGIRRILNEDFKYAKMLNSTIKMIGLVEKIKDINSNKEYLKIIVSPMIVNKNMMEANIKDCINIITINSDNLDQTTMIGRGAGKLPTANSIVNDLINITTNKSYSNLIDNNNLEVIKNWESKFYIRFRASDNLGIVQKIGEFCANNKISINSLLQLPIQNPKDIVFIMITEECSINNINKFKKEIKKENILLEEIFLMPIL
tara:strand:+ start:953 stop:2224 length:1272 start_codon:yes stop_codon:yes gene_type:complete